MMYYRIYGKAVFPEGIAPGEDKGLSNMITASRNGEGEPVLRGTALAGVLRSAFTNLKEKEFAYKWFGEPLDKEHNRSRDSLVYVADMVLNTGVTRDSFNSEIRTHNLINRHTGAVIKGGLFSLEAYPPNTSGDFLLYVKGCGDAHEDDEFACALGNVLGDTLYLGGNHNRGVGRMVLEKLVMSKFDTSTKYGMASWLNVRYADRKGEFGKCFGEDLVLKPSGSALSIKVEMQIPRGEDLVVGYGTSVANLQSEPQFVVKANGKRYWKIPGSSIRGVFRSWMNRLAARDGWYLADTHENWVQKKDLNGDKIGHAFVPKEQWETYQCKHGEKRVEDPIMDLFGTLFRRGRIFFSDAYSVNEAKDSDAQLRMHVAVDCFSGGANEGALFGNKVLVGGTRFTMQVSVENPSADERKWLLQTFNAINLGVISFGSSKASGLLEVTNMDEVEKVLTKEAV